MRMPGYKGIEAMRKQEAMAIPFLWTLKIRFKGRIPTMWSKLAFPKRNRPADSLGYERPATNRWNIYITMSTNKGTKKGRSETEKLILLICYCLNTVCANVKPYCAKWMDILQDVSTLSLWTKYLKAPVLYFL